ncbi:Mor transcription activator family protein [Edwardsiella anguillarum]|uniref:Putative transcription regulator n=1 Tax=Edwardsiella anguillarum ET080813 TaxID=667120 RepID=A0A076LUL9_9GAMM|nr:Mor transcription activator family protein [Edwardsiella anguillarum]AIJ09279.1 putative transcription regulator [Edwardsiella anguillarum ET080813]
MAEIQTDLFEGDPDAQQLFDHMDEIPVNELERQWPQMLVALIDVLECEIKRQAKTPHEPRQLARKLAAAMSHYMGGRSYYLPNGEVLFNSLRDDKIYREYDGRNMTALLKKYRLGQTQFYRIISRQRKLHMNRYQRDLFASH